LVLVHYNYLQMHSKKILQQLSFFKEKRTVQLSAFSFFSHFSSLLWRLKFFLLLLYFLLRVDFIKLYSTGKKTPAYSIWQKILHSISQSKFKPDLCAEICQTLFAVCPYCGPKKAFHPVCAKKAELIIVRRSIKTCTWLKCEIHKTSWILKKSSIFETLMNI